MKEATSYREQCYILCSILHDIEADAPIMSFEVIGSIFVPPKTLGSIIKEIQKYSRKMQAPHRPFFLNADEIKDIKEQITKAEDWPSIEDIAEYIAIKYRKYPSRSTFKRIVKEYIEDFKVV